MSTLLFDEYLRTVKFNDAFGHSEVWNAEVEKWLNSVDKSHIERNKRRFAPGREKQRDNFLAELCVSFYLQDKLKWKLEQIEPLGVDGHQLEYLLKDTSDADWYVEVKNSSWEKEVMDGDGTQKGKEARIRQPKYIAGDGRSFSSKDSYLDQIGKAANQFKPGNNNLLVIVPDTFVTPLVDPYLDEQIKEAAFDSAITSIAILDKHLPLGTESVIYNWKLIPIME